MGNTKDILSTSDKELSMDTATLLTPLGQRQVASNSAMFLRQHPTLKPENIILVSSDFCRAQQTADIVATQLQVLPYNRMVSPLLRDRFFGVFSEKSANFAHYLIMQNFVDPNWHLTLKPGYESQIPESNMDVFLRVDKLIQALENEFEGKTILLVSHRDTASIAFVGYQNLAVNKYWIIKPVGNGEVVGIH